LIAFAIALIVLIFLVAMFRHESLLQTLQFALVLLIAAIPAALPAFLSLTMACKKTGYSQQAGGYRRRSRPEVSLPKNL
jgi:H+-transporting ATPase